MFMRFSNELFVYLPFYPQSWADNYACNLMVEMVLRVQCDGGVHRLEAMSMEHELGEV